MNLLAALWFAFALVFSGLGVYHFGAASASIGLFDVAKSLGPKEAGIAAKPAADIEMDRRIQEFSAELNRYIATYNKSIRQQNIMAGIGYVAAALTAVLAMILELKEFLK
ncbi:MAG: hypothetical protein WAL90_14715 [Desulfobacterales bacterium]